MRECLESVLAQTWSPLEVLLIDDGSADGSREILASYAKQYSNVVVVHKDNEGVSKARNIGLQLAKGEFIAFCDSDDIMAPQIIEQLYYNLKSTGADISCCGFVRFTDTEKPDFQFKQMTEIITGDAMYAAVLQNPDCAGYPWNKLFRRTILNKNRYFPTDIAILEDEVFVLEALRNCRKLCVTSAQLYAYRNHPNSARNQQLSEKKLTRIIARERILQIVQRSVQSQELVSVAWNQLMRVYAITYKKLLHIKTENRSFWRKRIKEGFRKQKGQYPLDSSWNAKEKIYYLILRIAAH